MEVQGTVTLEGIKKLAAGSPLQVFLEYPVEEARLEALRVMTQWVTTQGHAFRSGSLDYLFSSVESLIHELPQDDKIKEPLLEWYLMHHGDRTAAFRFAFSDAFGYMLPGPFSRTAIKQARQDLKEARRLLQSDVGLREWLADEIGYVSRQDSLFDEHWQRAERALKFIVWTHYHGCTDLVEQLPDRLKSMICSDPWDRAHRQAIAETARDLLREQAQHSTEVIL